MDDIVRADYAPDLEDDKPVSVICIDHPNVVVRYAAVDWMRLSEHIVRTELAGTVLEHSGVYIPVFGETYEATQRLAGIFGQLRPTGFDPIVHRDKDIDSIIINATWKSIASLMTRSIKRDEKLMIPLKMRFILVSGDGDYLPMYRDIIGTYEHLLEAELVVYSWRDSLHKDLGVVANRVHYLDDIPDFKLKTSS